MAKPPPPDYHFECPPLSPEECEQYKQQALQNTQDLLEKANISNPRYDWKRISDEAEVEIFRGTDPHRPTSATLFCSTVDVAGTIEEVANFFRLGTQDESKEVIDRTDLAMLDITNLYTIHESQDLDIRVQWLLEKTPFDVVVKNRDFCFLKCTHFFDDDKNSRRSWVHCVHSIDIPCCPEFPNIVRGVHYCSGLVCRESARPGYIELTAVVHCDLRGTLLNVIKEKVIKELCRALKSIDRNLRQNRLTETPFLSGEQFVELSSRQRCHLCKRNFGFFRQKKHCFKCGEVVCSKCGPNWHIKVAGTSVKVRACTACSLLPRSSIAMETETAVSTTMTPSSAATSDVWRLADGEDASDDDDGVSFITDSNMSLYSASTGGRSTFDHIPNEL